MGKKIGYLVKWDKYITGAISVLTILGLINFYSVSLPVSIRHFNSPYYYFFEFLIKNVLFGIIGFVVFSLIPWKILRKISFPIFILFFIFLILPFHPFFRPPNQNTARWLDLKIVSFQPSEFIKFTFLLLLSFLIPHIQKFFKNPYERSIIFILLISIISLLIYLQPALSNLLIMLISIGIAYFSLKPDFKELLPFFLLIVIFIIASFAWGYRVERIIAYLKGGYQEISFQQEQAKLAVGSGGLFGRGIGNSKVKLLGIPLMITDSIFAIYAEETGFIGSIFLIILFIFLSLGIIRISFLVSNPEKKFFAMGVCGWIVIQSFLHIAANIGTIPMTGVPLPFFSYGPSSQISLMCALGVVSNLENS